MAPSRLTGRWRSSAAVLLFTLAAAVTHVPVATAEIAPPPDATGTALAVYQSDPAELGGGPPLDVRASTTVWRFRNAYKLSAMVNATVCQGVGLHRVLIRYRSLAEPGEIGELHTARASCPGNEVVIGGGDTDTVGDSVDVQVCVESSDKTRCGLPTRVYLKKIENPVSFPVTDPIGATYLLQVGDGDQYTEGAFAISVWRSERTAYWSMHADLNFCGPGGQGPGAIEIRWNTTSEAADLMHRRILPCPATGSGIAETWGGAEADPGAVLHLQICHSGREESCGDTVLIGNL